MTKADKIKATIQAKDFEQAMAILTEESPNSKALLTRLCQNKNWNLIEAQLQTLLQNPDLYQDEINEVRQLTTAEVLAIKKEAVKEDDFLSDDYPKHYPEILINKLKLARKLVTDKGNKSNQLYQKIPTPQPILVNEILELSEQVDFIYQAKYNFDSGDGLPKEWVIQDIEVQEQIDDLTHQLKNCRARISKNKNKIDKVKAIERNPKEWQEMTLTKQQDLKSKKRQWESAQQKEIATRTNLEERIKDLKHGN